jgi:transposase-like protein
MYTTHYESGSGGRKRFHHGTPTSLKKAIEQACRLSKKTGGYVTVEKNGREVASCYKGSQKTPCPSCGGDYVRSQPSDESSSDNKNWYCQDCGHWWSKKGGVRR